jgi:NitT/TauT family transport system substrate-binding protein
LKSPGVRTVLDSTDVMGGPATITVIFGTVKFHDANPKTIAAIMAALVEASDFIARDKRAAAELYLKATKEKISPDELTAMLESPGYRFTQAPNGTLRYAEQMFKTGVIKTRLANWKDAFFPEAHALPGN